MVNYHSCRFDVTGLPTCLVCVVFFTASRTSTCLHELWGGGCGGTRSDGLIASNSDFVCRYRPGLSSCPCRTISTTNTVCYTTHVFTIILHQGYLYTASGIFCERNTLRSQQLIGDVIGDDRSRERERERDCTVLYVVYMVSRGLLQQTVQTIY